MKNKQASQINKVEDRLQRHSVDVDALTISTACCDLAI